VSVEGECIQLTNKFPFCSKHIVLDELCDKVCHCICEVSFSDFWQITSLKVEVNPMFEFTGED
jgi:hypothetical protein